MARYTTPSAPSTFDSTFDSTFVASGSRIAGSRGGATFQKLGNVFGIRHRVAITNKRSPRQTSSRNRFESVQQFWRTLDSSEQQSFTDETTNYPRVNSLGDEYFISGINLQNVANTNANTQDLPPLESMPPPVPPPVIDIDTLAIDIGLAAMDVVTFPNVLPSTHSMIIAITAPFNRGTLNPGSPFVTMGVVPPSMNTANINWYQDYISIWGDVSAKQGQVFAVALHFVAQTTQVSSLSLFGVSDPIV